MKLGYNTNGLAHHRWQDAFALIADAGYASVAITVDHHCLNPFDDRHRAETAEVRRRLETTGLSSVIETGARFLLNPRVKHEPTLVSSIAEDRDVRVDFLCRCIDLAAELNSEAVSFWSGCVRDAAEETTAWQRLVDGCLRVVDHAQRRRVRLAFEPEPGMLIERMDQYARLADRIGSPDFGLTLDVGHIHCLGDGSIAEHLRANRDRLYNVHIEDIRRGIHEHLRFGEGEIDFAPVVDALKQIEYAGGVHVELSRHGHQAPDVLAESFQFLTGLLTGTENR